MLIGIHGKLQSGKDTCANYLVEHYGFQKIAFADILKQASLTLNPWILVEEGTLQEILTVYSVGSVLRLKTIVEKHGWEFAKNIPEVRRFLQVFGTECNRDIHGEDVWVRAINKRYGLDKLALGTKILNFVASDCRFIEEAEFIHSLSGEVYKVVRSVGEQDSNHPSEFGLSDEAIDHYIDNNEDLQSLYTQLDSLMEDLGIVKSA